MYRPIVLLAAAMVAVMPGAAIAQDAPTAYNACIVYTAPPDQAYDAEALTEAIMDGTATIIFAGACDGAPSAGAPSGPTHTITGSLTLVDGDGWDADYSTSDSLTGALCYGKDGYSDLGGFMNVVVSDGNGATIGTGTTGGGEVYLGTEDVFTFGCRFTFTVPDVPEVPFYEITVGRRGGPTYSLAEMNAIDWTVDLTIGS